jgi:hypothetical protein
LNIRNHATDSLHRRRSRGLPRRSGRLHGLHGTTNSNCSDPSLHRSSGGQFATSHLATILSLASHILNVAQASGWTLSVLVVANRAFTSFTSSLGPPYQSSRSSAASEIAAFARSASNYTIPPAVTDDGTTTTFFSQPDWYTALPSGARAFKEQQVSDQFSIVRSVIGSGSGSPTASSTGAAMPTAQAFLDAKFGAMAAAAAAVFL